MFAFNGGGGNPSLAALGTDAVYRLRGGRTTPRSRRAVRSVASARIGARTVSASARRLSTSTILARGGIALGVLVSISSVPASAQDATWLSTPGSNNYNTGTNWNPTTSANGPTGTALFGQSGTTSLAITSTAVVGGWTFNPGASNYTFTNNNELLFVNEGIVINGGSATINNIDTGMVIFSGLSKAGSATINNTTNGLIDFLPGSSADKATINNAGSLDFDDRAVGGAGRYRDVGAKAGYD